MQIIHKKQTYFEKKGGERIDKNGNKRFSSQAVGAREKLKYYSMSDAERYAYDEHINAIMIQNDVLGNARLEGMEEGRTKVTLSARKFTFGGAANFENDWKINM